MASISAVALPVEFAHRTSYYLHHAHSPDWIQPLVYFTLIEVVITNLAGVGPYYV